MNIKIGEKIKDLRKKADVKQEIFAPVREHVRFKTVITELEKHIKQA